MRILFDWKKNPTYVESQDSFSQSLNIFFSVSASATQVRTTMLFFYITVIQQKCFLL